MGWPREVNMREAVNAIFSSRELVANGSCLLPHDLLPKSTLYEYFSQWRNDGTAAPQLLAKVSPEEYPRLETIFGDNKYRNHNLNAWLTEHRPMWYVEIQSRRFAFVLPVFTSPPYCLYHSNVAVK